jgi:NADH-quinone oxidoreductase subunit N
VLSALLAFFLLSLIGIPFTGGFFGKFYVFTAAIHAGHVWLAVVGLLNSGVACFYYLRLLASVYARPEEQDAPTPSRISVPAGIGLTLTAVATLLLGVWPGHVLHLADYASWSLRIQTAAQACKDSPENCKVSLPVGGAGE